MKPNWFKLKAFIVKDSEERVFNSINLCLSVCARVCVSAMFASCCNWLCMDTANADQPTRSDRRHQSYTNSAFTSQPSPPPEHTCKACGGRLDTPATKVSEWLFQPWACSCSEVLWTLSTGRGGSSHLCSKGCWRLKFWITWQIFGSLLELVGRTT